MLGGLSKYPFINNVCQCTALNTDSLEGGLQVTNILPLGEIMLTAVETAAISEGVPTNRRSDTFACSPTREWSSGSYGTMSNSYQDYIKHYATTDFENAKCLNQCFPAFSTSRYPWPRSSYLTVPLEENIYFFKLIYFLIISYLRDITVYCCSVSVYSLINDVKIKVI